MRRFKEFEAKGIETTYQKVLEDMLARDKRDAERASAPMKPAEDAVIIDTSQMDAQTEIDTVLRVVEEKMKIS